MEESPDDLEKLLTDVRKTISDNKLFLDILADEAIEVEPDSEPDAVANPEEFEEL
jgi:hypothetical protein